MRPIFLLRALVVLLILTLVGMIVWSSLDRSLMSSLRDIAADPWGATTLVDLYAGLVVIGVWIGLVERRVLRTLPWLVGLACLGNLTTLVYVAQRAFRHATVAEAFGLRARDSR
jgi:F0F1-type ATP synthase assembly protein I